MKTNELELCSGKKVVREMFEQLGIHLNKLNMYMLFDLGTPTLQIYLRERVNAQIYLFNFIDLVYCSEKAKKKPQSPQNNELTQLIIHIR